MVASCCLSQDLLYINKRLREAPKIEIVQSGAIANKNKLIDDLFINFLLRWERMTYVIALPCIDVKDKACVDVCPVDCIHPTDGEGVSQLYIDPDECIDCGACEPECPVEAIFAEEDVPEEWAHFTKINADYFLKKE